MYVKIAPLDSAPNLKGQRVWVLVQDQERAQQAGE